MNDKKMSDNKNIMEALGENAKFYPNYLTNHVASDFKIHLNEGIGRLTEENKQLREAIEQLINYRGILTSDNEAVVNAKQLLNK